MSGLCLNALEILNYVPNSVIAAKFELKSFKTSKVVVRQNVLFEKIHRIHNVKTPETHLDLISIHVIQVFI